MPMLVALLFPVLLFSLAACQDISGMTAVCINAVYNYASSLQSTQDCADTFLAVATSENDLINCAVMGTFGINCMDYYSIVNQYSYSSELLRPYHIPVPSTCQFCQDAIVDSCLALLNQASALAAGLEVPPGLYDEGVVTNCADFSSQATLAGLFRQEQVICSASSTFGLPVTSAKTLDGVLDMRSLLQCGVCGVIACVPGQYCQENHAARMCPAGSYCPTPAERVHCPSGHYCPEASVAPVPCRDIAAGSCGVEGKTREVVWVPLFIAFCFFLAAAALSSPSVLPIMDAVIGSVDVSGSVHSIKKTASLQAFSVWEQILHVLSGGWWTPPHHSRRLAYNQVPLVDKSKFVAENDNHLISPRVGAGPAVGIRFSNLVKISGTNIRLNNVSGYIRPGRFTAIVGGSGAGKTTLMNVLLYRETKTAGDIAYTITGCPAKIPPYILEKVVAFVPQTDVLLNDMTVYQLLLHSARTRLPSDTTEAEIDKKIQDTLAQLDISHLSNIIAKRSSGLDVLSPGDKKKVSIAIELVADPRVLVLDEPTTGIDASSAMSVANIVRSLASTGITCIAVIHQPRGEIFALIDDIVVLVPGGKMAYQGPANLTLGWFAQFGYNLPHERANKADFLLDVTSGFYKKPRPSVVSSRCGDGRLSDLSDPEAVGETVGRESAPEIDVTIGKAADEDNEVVDWSSKWSEGGEAYLRSCGVELPADRIDPNKINAANPLQSTSMNCQSFRDSLNTMPLEAANLLSPRKGIFLQFLFYFCRSLVQRLKSSSLVVQIIMYFLAGSIMGIVTAGGPLFITGVPQMYGSSCPPGAASMCNNWLRFEIGPATFLITMLICAVTIPQSVTTFGREKEYFNRESAVGANKLAYYLGKTVADWAVLTVTTFVFMSALIAIAPWRAPADLLYVVLLSIAAFAQAISYLFSFLFNDPDIAVLAGVIFSILLNMFGGFVPTLGDSPQGQIFYTHYAARALVAVELKEGYQLDDEYFNDVTPDAWENPNWQFDVEIILYMALALHVLSCVMLFANNRRKFRSD